MPTNPTLEYLTTVKDCQRKMDALFEAYIQAVEGHAYVYTRNELVAELEQIIADLKEVQS